MEIRYLDTVFARYFKSENITGSQSDRVIFPSSISAASRCRLHSHSRESCFTFDAHDPSVLLRFDEKINAPLPARCSGEKLVPALSDSRFCVYIYIASFSMKLCGVLVDYFYSDLGMFYLHSDVMFTHKIARL